MGGVVGCGQVHANTTRLALQLRASPLFPSLPASVWHDYQPTPPAGGLGSSVTPHQPTNTEAGWIEGMRQMCHNIPTITARFTRSD